MGMFTRGEWRKPPEGVVREARLNPGAWVYEIDVQYGSFGYVPPEAIGGCWKVDGYGATTGEFRRNPNHGIPRDDLTALNNAMLVFLGEDPGRAVKARVQKELEGELMWLKLLDEPSFVSQGDAAGMAVSFALGVRTTFQPLDVITGAFTWAAGGLEVPPRRDRVWFDVGAELGWAEEQLRSIRIFEVG